MTRAVVFANGECSASVCTRAKVSGDDLIVCVDGGLRHCVAAGLQPDMLIGDLDSYNPQQLHHAGNAQVEIVRFPSKKDTSDLELALRILTERSVDSVVLVGISGGRTDHLLFNWQLPGARTWPFRVRLIDEFVDAYLVDHTRPFSESVSIGQTFSLVALATDAKGVRVDGAMYPLANAHLPIGSTLGLSNETSASHLQVTVDVGMVLVMLVCAES